MLRMPAEKVLAIVPALRERPVELRTQRGGSAGAPRGIFARGSLPPAVPDDGLLLLTDGQTLAGGPVRDFSTLDALQEAMPWQSLTLDRVVMVFGLTALMCAAAGTIALRRVYGADPAEVF
jgi:hypothetical protein